MNAVFGVLEESGEGDLRSTMSSGLGLIFEVILEFVRR